MKFQRLKFSEEKLMPMFIYRPRNWRRKEPPLATENIMATPNTKDLFIRQTIGIKSYVAIHGSSCMWWSYATCCTERSWILICGHSVYYVVYILFNSSIRPAQYSLNFSGSAGRRHHGPRGKMISMQKQISSFQGTRVPYRKASLRPDNDILTRTSWADAALALAQINKVSYMFIILKWTLLSLIAM